MADLGRFALLVALGAAVWGAVSGFVGARSGREAPVRSAEGALRAAALSLTVAAAALWWALATRDFSIRYVAEYTSRTLSMFYTLGAFWAGQAGSLLLWAWVLALGAALVVRQNRRSNRDLAPYVVTVLAGALAFFTFLVAFTSNPFERLGFTPPDGQGLNPLLQNYGQWFHPLAIYLGFVGFTVPFAFCIAALATGNLGDHWIRTVRKWTVWSWVLLTAGIVLGARWAYVELGWGGYWAWDPVENASLLPWLTATAYLHSVMVQERRGMLKVWNVVLIVATFGLTIFGTFLTRSGVVSSVHAFAQSSIGPLLVGAVVAVIVLSGALLAVRLPQLRTKGSIEAVVSRESSFLLNNLLLVGIAFAVLWGTVYPLVAQAVRGVSVSVGPPFFEALVSPMAVALLALVGLCPMLAWRKASLRNLRRNFVIPLVSGLVAFGILALLSGGEHLGAQFVLALVAFVTVTLGLEFLRGARARRHVKHESWGTALLRLFSRSPRRYGGYLTHLGAVVLIAGIVVNVAYKQETRTSLSVGESMEIADYRLVLRDLNMEETPAKSSLIATLAVSGSDGESLGVIRTERNLFATEEQPTTEVGIRATPAEDLYVILQSADVTARVASLVVLINPGVFWIWAGGLILLIGGVIVGWPERRKEVTRATRELERALG